MNQARYPNTSIAVHWITLLAVFAAVVLGMKLEHPPEGWGDTLYRLHWSFGMTVLFLTMLRILNRFLVGAPPPYAGLTPVERLASGLVHKALYGMLVLVPLLGWLGKSAYGGDITIFGLFNMPPLLGKDEALSKTLLGAHKLCVKLFMLCLVLHVAGALNHALIKRDGVLARMLPFRKP